MSSSFSPSPSPSSAPLTADALAALIQQLTSPTSTNFRHAETTILAHLSSLAVIDPLSQLLSHPAPEVRHFSAILLRRALAPHDFHTFPELLQPVKSQVLPLLTSEPNPAARRGLIALSSYICRVQNSLWPQLTTVAIQLSQSPDPLLRASAFSIFQSLCDTAPDLFLSHLSDIARVLSTGLSDSTSTVRLAALRAFSAAANPKALGRISAEPLVDLLPLIVALATTHPNRASDEYARIASNVFDALAYLMDNVPARLMPKFFNDACTLALSVFPDHATCRQARSAANEFLIFSIARKPNSARSDGIALATVQNACAVVFHEAHRVALPPDEHDDVDVDDGDYDPIHLSLRILYAMAKRPELAHLVFTNVLSSINSNFNQAGNSSAAPVSPFAAGYRMIAAIAEGCGSELTQHARQVLPQIVSGALDDTPGFPTRARAIEAVGAVCEYLDTHEISDELIVELANSALDAVVSCLCHNQTFVCKAACVALEPVLALYVPGSEALRARVGDILRALGNVGADVTEEAVMAIGVLAEHAPDAFNESDMYGDVIQWVLQVMANTAEDRYLVRAAATSAAGALMASCSDHSVVEKLATHAISGIDSDEAPLRQATFRFFARMADVIGGSVVAVFGPRILKSAVESMERETVNYGDDDVEDTNTALFNSTDGEMDDEDDDVLEIHTAYLDEKMVAVATVGAFASACGSDEYVERVSQSLDVANEVQKLFGKSVPLVDDLQNFFQEDVRSSALQAMCRMAVANEILKEKRPPLAFSDVDLVKETFCNLTQCIQGDTDIDVVTNTLNSCAAFLGHVQAKVVMEHKGSIVSSLHLLLSQDTLSQYSCKAPYWTDYGEYDDGEDDDGEAEGNVMDGLGEVIVAMGVALRGYFAEDFGSLLTVMVEGMCSSKASARNKGTALGTVAAVLLYLNWDRCTSVVAPEKGSASYELAYETTDSAGARLIGIALDSVQNSESRTVRQNAMFLLGVIFAKTRGERREVWDLLPVALVRLEGIIGGGKSGHGALMDNAAGALARIMFSSGLDENRKAQRRGMLRAVLKCVPVKNDPSENTSITGAIVKMGKLCGLNVLLEADMVDKVICCLVGSILCYRSLIKKRSGRTWTMEIDVCDEIALYTDEDMKSVVQLMQKLMQVVGEGELKKLNLSIEDEVGLSEMISIYGGS